MILWIIIALSFAPGIYWLWYFYEKDELEPEPIHLIRRTFLLGIAVAFPVAFLESLLEIPFGPSELMGAVIIAPIIEEIGKYSVVRATVYRHAEFDEPLDGIMYAAAAALGFASIENVFYVWAEYDDWLNNQASSGTAEGFGAVIGVYAVRAVLSVPGHVLDSSMWGYALGRAKFSPPEKEGWLTLEGLAAAVGCHALFNFCLVSDLNLGGGVLLLTFGLWRVVLGRIDHTLRLSPHGITATGSAPGATVASKGGEVPASSGATTTVFCPHCRETLAVLEKSEFCPVCGMSF